MKLKRTPIPGKPLEHGSCMKRQKRQDKHQVIPDPRREQAQLGGSRAAKGTPRIEDDGSISSHQPSYRDRPWKPAGPNNRLKFRVILELGYVLPQLLLDQGLDITIVAKRKPRQIGVIKRSSTTPIDGNAATCSWGPPWTPLA
ncbi:hypothetical protein GX48_02662 [Paracoccidioides brasiliensis]|nr:hypothetical protein GX48_02662 [Paracoccidioides brasiliensis]